MSLLSEVQLRYDAQRLKELSNVRNRAAATVDLVKLQQACDSATAWFKVYAQQVGDITDTTHLDTLCDGVVACLQKWGGAASGVKRIRWDDWTETCRDLAKVGPRGHEPPQTDSVLEPSQPDTSAGPVRPAFDDSLFDRTTPSRTGGRSDIDE